MASEGVVCLLLGSGGLLVFRPVGLPLSEAACLQVLPAGWEGRGAERVLGPSARLIALKKNLL